MPYLSRDSQGPDGQNTPVEANNNSEPQTRGSAGWAIALTVVGWVLLMPAALVIGAFAVFAAQVSPEAGGTNDFADSLPAILGAASALCAPIILGLALYRKSGGLWLLGALVVIPAVIATLTLGTEMF